MSTGYEDIIYLPHPDSSSHPRMSAINRAAQFSPFAALTGYEDAVKETARLTQQRTELDEYEKDILNEKLCLMAEHAEKNPEILVTYFVKDEKKAGGAYVTITGNLKKIDIYTGTILLHDGTKILMKDILELEGDLFSGLG